MKIARLIDKNLDEKCYNTFIKKGTSVDRATPKTHTYHQEEICQGRLNVVVTVSPRASDSNSTANETPRYRRTSDTWMRDIETSWQIGSFELLF